MPLKSTNIIFFTFLKIIIQKDYNAHSEFFFVNVDPQFLIFKKY